MAEQFGLTGRVSSDRPEVVRAVLDQLLGAGSVRRAGDEFELTAVMSGPSAKELNRELLSALRRAEKRTRLRSEWTGEDGTRYRFFDYVLKKTTPP